MRVRTMNACLPSMVAKLAPWYPGAGSAFHAHISTSVHYYTRRTGEQGVAAVAPVEGAAVNDHTANGGA